MTLLSGRYRAISRATRTVNSRGISSRRLIRKRSSNFWRRAREWENKKREKGKNKTKTKKWELEKWNHSLRYEKCDHAVISYVPFPFFWDSLFFTVTTQELNELHPDQSTDCSMCTTLHQTENSGTREVGTRCVAQLICGKKLPLNSIDKEAWFTFTAKRCYSIHGWPIIYLHNYTSCFTFVALHTGYE